jgi:Tol biopolymer transport system component
MRLAVTLALAASICVGIGGQTALGPAEDRPTGLIVFNADPTNDGPWYNQLLVGDLDTGRIRQLTHRAAGGYNPSWSPDGTQIAFDWETDGPCNSPACNRIFLINADGTRRRPFTPANLRCEQAAWSPTDDRIAYVQWRRSADLESIRSSIWLRSIDGNQVRRLTFARKAFDSDPVWSPDGTQIVFSRDADSAASGNYVVNVDGTGLHRLRGNRRTHIRSWSSDGRHLTGTRRYGRFNNKFLSVVLNSDGSGERLLLRRGLGPVWSPDDQFIAFVPEYEDISHGWVSVVRADGTGRRKLVRGKFTQPAHLDWVERR